MENFETDWLASRPVFYNEKTKKVSYNLNDVVDFNDFQFHPEGLNNYLDFGYSILGQTPIKYVRFLNHSSKITIKDKGHLEITNRDDLVDTFEKKHTHEDDVLHLLCKSINKWEGNVDGEIVIPISGGFDSRLLAFFIKSKKRIRSFTYGTSTDQSKSFEVVFAYHLSQRLGIKWQFIPLGDYHHYIDQWYKLFGASTHAHGMYHLEFYHKILLQVSGNNPLLSGIFGDVWAGNVEPIKLTSPIDLYRIGYTHGLRADPEQSKLKSHYELRHEFFESNFDKLNDPYYQIIYLIRLKIILISYLLTVPRHLGYNVWSPFLEPGIALRMLLLHPDRRKDRIWQREFFSKNGLDPESRNLIASYENNLNLQAMNKVPLSPLDVNLLREVISKRYIHWINSQISRLGVFFNSFYWAIKNVPKIRGVAKVMNIKDCRLKAYYAYLTLLPIQNLLKERDSYRKMHDM